MRVHLLTALLLAVSVPALGRVAVQDGSDHPPSRRARQAVGGLGCGPGEFRCLDGTCIEDCYTCDTRADCPDGSDETEAHGCAERCGDGRFRCDGRCLDNRQLCDGRADCPSGTDERCIEDGRCIPYCYRCDGGVECVDGSDEIDCPGQTTTPRPCFYYEFRCDDRCVDNRLRCDGRWDCSDGSDEWGCTTTTTTTPRPPPPPPPPGCRTDQFECLSGEPRCIDSCYACDGRKDCADNSDESEEYGCSRTEQCTTGEYSCDGRCLPVETLCDGVPHCSDGHDERNCIRGVLVA
ncbi:Low-density lipoprotein receptor-related protein [Amphibalanus amphitrite]|uniref:Low-density lipoprotein receptor-related protein n=1 Tax=Amphibalanus amphitrite TaxID=1232801 RepID=A0A6A4WS22_AMPAM|nr:Low-density lipoprotein receptor-related protein [Amphibalanus amphitrite]